MLDTVKNSHDYSLFWLFPVFLTQQLFNFHSAIASLASSLPFLRFPSQLSHTWFYSSWFPVKSDLVIHRKLGSFFCFFIM